MQTIRFRVNTSTIAVRQLLLALQSADTGAITHETGVTRLVTITAVLTIGVKINA